MGAFLSLSLCVCMYVCVCVLSVLLELLLRCILSGLATSSRVVHMIKVEVESKNVEHDGSLQHEE